MKTYSEGRIELQNLQFLKKMLEKSSQFLLSDQSSEPKSLDVALNIAGVEMESSPTEWKKAVVNLPNIFLKLFQCVMVQP